MLATKVYLDSVCTGIPNAVSITESSNCSADDTCKRAKAGDNTYNISSACIEDRFDYAAEVYDSLKFVVLEHYNTTGCIDLIEAVAYQASGICVTSGTTASAMFTVSLNETTGDVNITTYTGDICGEEHFYSTIGAKGSNVSTRDESYCLGGIYKFYSVKSLGLSSVSTSASGSTSNASSSAVTSSSSSGSTGTVPNITIETDSEDPSISVGAIAGIVVAVLVLVLVVIGYLWYRWRSKMTESSDADKHGGGYAQMTSPTTGQKSTDTGITDFSSSLGLGPRSLAGLWDDEVIATSRIQRDKVLVQQMISRGGYGEVYYGLFLGKRVAIKTLLPELRKSVKHVNDFLDEVRLLARLDHPRIVQFVGIAWDTLPDLCFVLEYLEGGDLRALLVSYEAQGHGVGFDRSKVTIALHVAHALTYLHSLNPPVLHRDLKSKNILLSSELEAKVTDFGISRERVDNTMTAGVGTSLWMAPEVMLGQRYDDKADIFSFGVVLSELDLHTLPYSHAKDNSNSGRKMPDTAILQMVVLGRIRVEFSSGALESMVALGNSCVAVDPKDRPTAAEALYQLQTILHQAVVASRSDNSKDTAKLGTDCRNEQVFAWGQKLQGMMCHAGCTFENGGFLFGDDVTNVVFRVSR